ncbi:type I-E CRISPR-associated protein Cse2/CasB [Streptomyces wuyuanensis]|uniref:CRISPR system Cascade subunit CasB/CRISPR system Cascade subunit CasA n=1 Tax=Streptomyces wuyuanensis TaxID=1196353 RepID=A0A1H0DTI5_9ACTN|nr:type I-E CRISPR-associated protein Cse2/CasB [Streptomyces wuyuanensis]SDN73445.1 CRISPR system Cascade subunit CasB/CRISPR system Cascade subunit CasA [Streptomyces wuyuanensis]
MSTMAERRTAYDAYVTHIHGLCRDPGTRRRLSTGLGRPVEECAQMDKLLTRYTAGRPGRRAHYTVASLIALAGPEVHTPGVRPTRRAGTLAALTEPAGSPNPPATGVALDAWFRRPNLGTALAAAVLDAGWGEDRTADRLHVMTRVGEDQLHRRLPTLIRRLLSDGLTPDWGVLLHDLIQRSYRPDTVGLRWRDAFYLTLHQPATD